MSRPRFLVGYFVVMVAQLIWVLHGDALDRAIRLGGVSLEPEDGYHAAGIARDEPFVLKNLLIHSARDLGDPGPDYAYGHGLVNDLDVWLGSPYGDLGLPFVLDPQNPTLAASRGRNEIDNVESVSVENPVPASWKVVVEGTRIAMAPERYSLIVSASGGNQPLLLLPEGECEVLDFYTTIDDEAAQTIRPWSNFGIGDPLNMYLAFSVPENADYGNYFGSLTVGGSITNRFGEEVYRIAADTHQLPAIEFREEVGSGLEIPEGLPVGPYTARLALRMHNGAECSSEYAFSVQESPETPNQF